MAMGPFATMDLSGNDVCYAIRKRQEVEGSGKANSELLDRVAEMGRYGQKTGAGFAMPPPIVPAPMTATLAISRGAVPAGMPSISAAFRSPAAI